MTGGAVTSINQIARLKLWLAQQGCITDTLDKTGIENLLVVDNLALAVHRALELRQSGAQAAAKKIDALLARCDRDRRIRGTLRYHGASTGRWAGNGVQPQNLKRPQIEDVDAAVAAIGTGDYTHVRKLYPKPLAVIGDISRSIICAAPGHKLIGADFSSIESRVLAWISDEAWKLDSYRRFDATQDPRDEPYCITACKIFRVPDGTFNAESSERKVGKTCDLAFGYQGGLNAWRKFEPDRFSDAVAAVQIRVARRPSGDQTLLVCDRSCHVAGSAPARGRHSLPAAAAEMHWHVLIHQAAVGAQARLSLPTY